MASNLFFTKLLCVPSVLFLFFSAKAQDNAYLIDSLWSAYANTTETQTRIELLHKLGYFYVFQPGKLDSALILFDDALEYIEKESYQREKGINDFHRALYYNAKGDFPKAIDLTTEAKAIFETVEDRHHLLRAYINLGDFYRRKGDFKDGEATLLELLEILEPEEDNAIKSSAFHNLANIYKNSGSVLKALEYYEKSLALKRSIYNKKQKDNSQLRRIGNTLDAMGGLYQEAGDTTKAKTYYFEGLKIRREIGHQEGMMVSLYNLGTYYENTAEFEEAIDYYLQALELMRESGNKNYEAYCLNSLASVYNKTNKYDLATKTYSEALDAAQGMGTSPVKKAIHQGLSELFLKNGATNDALIQAEEALNISEFLSDTPGAIRARKTLAEINKRLGNESLALNYLQTAFDLKDSLINANQIGELEKVKARLEYEVDQQKKTLELLALENKLTRSKVNVRTNTIIGLLIGLLIIFSLLGLIWKNNAKLKKSLEIQHSQNTHLNDLSNKLQNFIFAASHDLIESLRGIVSFSQLLAKQVPKTSSSESYVNEITSSGKNMKNTLDNLVEYSKLNAETLNRVEVDLNEVLDSILTDRDALHNSSVHLHVATLPKIKGDKFLLHKLFGILIDNAFKFGEPGRELSLEIGQQNDTPDLRTIFIKDNGIGMEEEYLENIFKPFFRLHDRSLSGSGLGLAICEQIMLLHSGKIWADSEKGIGTTIYLAFSKN